MAIPFGQSWARALGYAALLACLAGCADNAAGNAIQDPYEAANRERHARNLLSDRRVLRPLAHGYGRAVPEELRRAANNFAANLGEPKNVVNALLQGRLDNAATSTTRFAFNTVVGLGGFLDPASAVGLAPRGTDFGETLYVWGVGEGAYLELPLIGPATTRHAVGRAVDLFTNPLPFMVDPGLSLAGLGATGMRALDRRHRLTGTVDGILYESADSYVQTRLLYLQSRRFKLRGMDDADITDPFAELDDE